MCKHAPTGRGGTQGPGTRVLGALRRWWRHGGAEERYLAAATDAPDLERRMRALERASGGPAFPTFNH
jgi:hypothetical protein